MKNNIIQMKNYSTYFFIFFLMFGTIVRAQSEEDALRYAKHEIKGSARFTGMSGAFSSLGGDMSALALNPAGATTFSTNRFSATLSYFGKNNQSTYFGASTDAEYSSIDHSLVSFDQIGGVMVYKSDVSKWNKIAFAFNYNKEANYGSMTVIEGKNPNHTIVDYFLGYADGIKKNDLDLGNNETITGVYKELGEASGYGAQQAFLGYQAQVINPVSNDANNTQYNSNATFSGPLTHFNQLRKGGNKSRYDFTFAATFKDKLQLGFAYSSYDISYTDANTLKESDYASSSDLKDVKFVNKLRVTGEGKSVKFGAIYRPMKPLRLSLAYHSPEWLDIEENLTQSLYTSFADNSSIQLEPDVESAFAPYRVITPSKVIAGASYVIKKSGLISVDYPYQNYQNLRFKENENEDSNYFDTVNEYMSDNFQAVHKLNVGVEMRFEDLSLRGGGFLSTSPYKNAKEYRAPKGYSLGLGYDFGDIEADLSFMSVREKTDHRLLSSGISDMAQVNSVKNNYLFTLRYNF